MPFRSGPFDRYLSEGMRDTGWFVGGTGWYRKRFTARALGADRHIEIVFDGVYMNSDLWLNGEHLGNHPYGYTWFAFDLTPYLHRQGENVLAVRVLNQGRNSRWYSGSGIYRHVWLTVTSDVRVPLWGVYVTTPEVSKDSASVKVNVKLENRGSADAKCNGQGTALRSGELSGRKLRSDAAGGGGQQRPAGPLICDQSAPPVVHGNPTTLSRRGRTGGGREHGTIAPRPHSAYVRLRSMRSAGFESTARPSSSEEAAYTTITVCSGAAAIDRAEERRVELLKSYGFNAIRCSHNPPSPAFLDACDRLGMVVIDEAFDHWTIQKNPQDYHLYFKEWWQRDIDAMVMRDRNHPSVVFWSIGNEIPERADAAGVAIAKQIVDEIKRLDPTRPITAAIPFFFESGGCPSLD